MASVMCRDSGGGAPRKRLEPIQPLSVDSERAGGPPGEAASLGLCREIHHARTRKAAGRQCGSISLPRGGLLFFPPLLFFSLFTSSTLSVPH